LMIKSFYFQIADGRNLKWSLAGSKVIFELFVTDLT
jgi:hypothetical protein